MDRAETYRFGFLKAVVGAGWLDKAVTAETLNVLKTYLRRVNMCQEETVGLKPFLSRVIREREAHELVDDYVRWNYRAEPHERNRAILAISDLVEDDDADESDDRFLANVRILTGPFQDSEDFLVRVAEVMKQGGIAEPVATRRTDDLDEFVRTRIMHSVKSKMLDLRLGGDLSPREVAYVTSLSALLGRIAHADDDFSEEEKQEISGLLKESTSLSHDDIDVIMATIIDDTLRGLDLKSVTRTFYNLSTPEQRETLLNCLYLVAGADGHIEHAEIEEIKRIAVGLNMSHGDILRAKANAMSIVRQRLS